MKTGPLDAPQGGCRRTVCTPSACHWRWKVMKNSLQLLVFYYFWCLHLVPICTGVQYVHWVMHKCIMVKVGENEIHIKYGKAGEFF